jgi:hypothetical protein
MNSQHKAIKTLFVMIFIGDEDQLQNRKYLKQKFEVGKL